MHVMICHSTFNASHTVTKGYYPLISCLRYTYSANLPPGDFGNITQSKTIIPYKNRAERRGLRLSTAAFVFYKQFKMSAAALKPSVMGAAALGQFY